MVQHLHLFDVSDAVMHSNQNFGLVLKKKKKGNKKGSFFYFPFSFCLLWIHNKNMHSITVVYSRKKNTVLLRAKLVTEHHTNLKKTFFQLSSLYNFCSHRLNFKILSTWTKGIFKTPYLIFLTINSVLFFHHILTTLQKNCVSVATASVWNNHNKH